MPENSQIIAAKKPRIIAVANQKGGVGKTTTTVNLATTLAAVGRKVILVDLDPQGNASTGLGIPHADRALGSYNLLFDNKSLADVSRGTIVPDLRIAPASADLAGAEIELIDTESREHRLRLALEKTGADANYIMIDCPPSLGLLTLNALIAAKEILVPAQCEFYALEGLSNLVKTIDRVRKNFNPALNICGIALTMFDARNNLSQHVADDVRDFFGKQVFETVIPRNVRISEAPSHGKPALLYDPKCPGSKAYMDLAREVIGQEKALSPLPPGEG